MTPLRLFWWAPGRNLRLAWPEAKTNPGVWIRLGLRTGRIATNFGDELSSHVVEAVTRRQVQWAEPRSAELVAIGSVLGLYAAMGSGAAVWGTGIREPISPGEAELLKGRLGPILAVRGNHTRDALGLPSSTALGDAGMLAPMFASRSTLRKKGVLAIPHFRAWSSRSGRETVKQLTKVDIDIAEPTLHPRAMIERISNSSLVLTSSLHGLILGHSLGVPTQLVSWDGEADQEPDFKYADYFSSVGHEVSRLPIQLALEESKINEIHQNCEGLVKVLEKKTSTLAEHLVKAIEGF
ncbi:polysaccharide pyruvyl transferase family protein [Arthrobacter sp. AL12]|uniref:polysaccharide pyruvyl transferase family protein n=1 Tax=Arthrobacter sp. AL12 TaxID=3042241 RepID=UPI00249C1EDF|nr:polysaccharide pyruvyl transferase family protein [Arthrobacter sp. AL12]MDI3213094.1 polysaccharide pyruvyl transferase family protein [Arthrobacter sp. AL12]